MSDKPCLGAELGLLILLARFRLLALRSRRNHTFTGHVSPLHELFKCHRLDPLGAHSGIPAPKGTKGPGCTATGCCQRQDLSRNGDGDIGHKSRRPASGDPPSAARHSIRRRSRNPVRFYDRT